MAQKIASKYSEIYISDQLGAKDESITRARSALAEELEKVRKRSVDAELAVYKFRTDNALTNDTLVTLRQLELEASSLKSQYEQVMERYQSSLQNPSMALTEARVISEAPSPQQTEFSEQRSYLGGLRRARRHGWYRCGRNSGVSGALFPHEGSSAR